MKIIYTLIAKVAMVVLCCVIIFTKPAINQNAPGGGSISVYDSLLDLYNNSKGHYDYPPTWDEPEPNWQAAPHFIIVTLDANPRINSILLEEGDYIGGFYTDDNGDLQCGGAKPWNDTTNISIGLRKNDYNTSEKDGFLNGEQIYFKFFSWTTLKDYDVSVIDFDEDGAYGGTDHWGSLNISVVLDMQAQVDMDFYISPQANPICIGDELLIEGKEFIGTGGPYTFSWTSDPSGFLSELQAPLPTTPTETTTYFLSVEDGLFTSEHELIVVVNEFPEAYAGPDGSVCGNETFSLNGSATYNDGIMWTSSGDGFFDDPTLLISNYSPGDMDNQNGNVNITLIANPLTPCTVSFSDELQLQILSLPVVDAGEDRSACGNDAIILDADAQFYSSIEWISSGDGIFSNPTEPLSQYTPGPDDIEEGLVTIQVCAEGILPCVGTVCSELSISFLVGPSCNGPSSRTKCENVPVPLVGIASNNNGTLWTTQGDGNFVNPSVINTQYIAGPQDCANGGTVVTLNALPIAPCATTATKDVTIILKPLPDVYAGEDISVVDFDSIILPATVSNYTTILWQTSGDGQFTCTNATITQYMPGINDILTGSTVITVTAGAITPCSGTVSDEMVLFYEEVATVYAGDNISICKDDEVYLEGTASNYQSIEWSTSGDGSFLDIYDLTTTYIPGNNDIASGELNLTLSAIPLPPETNPVSDQLLLTINKDAEVTAISDQLICESQDVQLSATANNYSAIEWTSNGDGVFSNPNILSPAYLPGLADKQNGEVELTVSVTSILPCTYADNDLVNISITKNPVVVAGTDAEICETSNLSLSGQVQNTQQFSWQSNGDGYFDNAQNLQTNYHPGSQDIENGTVEITLSGEAIAPCVSSVNDNLSLAINKPPVVSAGSDHSICETENVGLNGTASNYSSLSWISSGDGDFTNPDGLVTNYIPGSQDKENEYVSVTLVANPLSPCTISEEDDADILITRMPFSNAGNNTTICENEVVELNGEALNYTSIDWSTSGDGYFDGKGTLSTTYTPGPGDINTGYVTLCLIATSSGACLPYTDCITATIVSLPETFAGNNNTVTYGFSYPIEEAFVKNAESFIWTSPNGAGSFDTNTIINPVYTPGFDDLITKTIIIKLTAQPNSPCLIESSHSFELTVSSDCQDALANAGADMVVCTTSTVELSASSASNYTSIEWTSNGDGNFSNPNILNPVYTPGTNDLSAGTVDLCLTAYASDICQDESDCLTLTFQQPPTIIVGEDFTVCEGSTASIIAVGDHYNDIIWTTNGDGTFDNAGESNTTYTPGSNDINNGNVTLCATATGISGCGDAVDCIQISMQKSPSANAGMDQEICAGSKVFLNGMAENFDATHWESNGDGSFNNPNLFIPTYTPGSQDISNGTVELCLKATGLFNCADQSDCMVVIIHEPPVVFPGLTETVCEGDVMYLNAYAENYQNVVWSTSGGDGNFLDKNALVTEYYPGPGDIDAGGVALCITAIGFADCDNVFDCIINTINKQAIAIAGIDQTICSGANATFTGNAENYSTFDWQTTGDGIFTNPDDLSTDYIPGMQDLALGQVNICLDASGQQGCNDQNHCITLTIEQPPDVLVSNVDIICEDDILQLSATANHYSSVLWQTNGDGNFNNNSILNPVYTPGPIDINTGQVELCITASPVQGCNAEEDCVTAYIQQKPVVYAGPNVSIESGETFTPDSATAENYATLYWTSSGSGTFNNPASLNTVYTPAAADYIEGAVILSLSASAINPCTVSVEDDMVLGLSPDCNPLVDAGDDISICEDQLVQLDGFVFNSPLVLWTTSGDGSFNDASLVNSIYTPGPNDLLSENTELCLTAFATGTCEDKSDCLIFTSIRNAEASAGNNRTVPMVTSIELSDAYVDNYSQIQWTTLNGTGEFNSENIVNPTYDVLPPDYDQGSVIFQIISAPISPCSTYSDDMVEISFEEECSDVIITLAEEIHSCNTVFTYTIDAAADNFSSLFWTTSGDGSFNHTNTINPEYHCGPNDESLGQVTLSLYAEGFGACNSTNASTELIFHPEPTANAGNDATICGPVAYTILGSASEYESISWSTSGDGTFVNQNALNPTYIPGDNDMINGSAVLCLEADGYGMHLPANDCMVLTLVSPPEISAGGNMNICGGQTIQLQAYGQNFKSVSWQTNGDGSFSNQNSLTATYTPGQNDLTDTLVELCITAHPNDGCDETNDCLIVSFQETAYAYAGNDASVDVGMNYQIDDAIAENEASIAWTTSGTGTFDSSFIQNPIYFPSDVDYDNVSVTLTLTVNPICPCSFIEIDEMILGFNQVCQDAVAIAGDNIDICITNPIFLSGDAENYSAVKWETQSDGTFENEYENNTIYYPGEDDKIAGLATLCFTAFANGVCSDDTDCLTINMYMPPLANAGDNISVCETTQDIELFGSASNYSSYSWSTTGDGTFSDVSTLTSVYHPGAMDIFKGNTSVNLTASSDYCDAAVDEIMIYLEHMPFAYAGDDISSCGNASIDLTGSANNYSSLIWTTSGDGTFTDTASATSSYEPGINDILTGTVELCLNVQAINHCNNIADCVIITIKSAPTASAGEDNTICETSPFYVLSGQTSFSDTIFWLSDGDGYFDGPQALEPNYYPGPGDKSVGYVNICLTAGSNFTCSPAEDCMLLTITKGPAISLSSTLETCVDDNPTLSAQVENYETLLWTTSGDGTFTHPTNATTQYVPGTSDIQVGTVELLLTATGNEYCDSKQAAVMLSIHKAPVAHTGGDKTIYIGQVHLLSEASVEYSNTCNWVSDGSGYFDDADSLHCTYYPSQDDYDSTQVTLTLTAIPQDPCLLSSEESMLLAFIVECVDATADAGGDQDVCMDSNVSLNGIATDYFSVLWETDGDGYFIDPQALNTEYIPGGNDLSSQEVGLCLNAFAVEPCEDAIDCVTVIFYDAATANAGDDIDVCKTVPFIQLDGAVSNNVEFYWSTNGTGSFVPTPTTLSPKYFPSYYDTYVGQIDIYLTATHAICGEARDTLTLTFHAAPTVDAGGNASICANETFTTLTASASDEDAVLWETDGDGYFDDTERIISTYFPGPIDQQNGSVELCLTAIGYAACGNVSDCLILSLSGSAMTDAGIGQTICEDEFIQLSASADNYSDILWSSSGDGSFNDASILNPEYYPGDQDKLNMTVTLTIEAFSSSNCGDASDDVMISIVPSPIAFAGEDVTICENETVQIIGTAENFSDILWSTDGDGSFNLANSLTAVYTPGDEDIQFGLVELCLTAYGLSDCVEVIDCVNLYIQANPTVFAGNDAEVCQNQSVQLGGQAENYSSVIWSTQGDGTFSPPDALMTNYTPGNQDITNGTVELCLEAMGLESCGSTQHCINLIVHSLPVVDAGIDLSACEINVVEITASAENYSALLWTSSGDGEFSSANQLGTSYTPGENDIATGHAELCIKATGMGSCDSKQDCINLTIFKLPEVEVGENLSICAGEVASISGQATNYASIVWMSDGDGTFGNPNSFTTNYTPGEGDLTAGIVNLCLIAEGMGECSEVSDCLALTIQALPTAAAGDDDVICEDDTFALDGHAENYSSIFWTTSGTGGFSNPQTLDPIYYPSPADKQNGTVELCLKANGNCGNKTDCLTLTINHLAEAIAGTDLTICESGILNLSGQANNANGIVWETSGDGVFEDNTLLETTYTPGEQDLLNGSAQVCLKAQGMYSCPEDTDCLTVNFQQNVLVFAGDDFSSCETAVIPLSGWAENFGSINWSTSGDGLFADASELNTSYLPGPSDLFNGTVELCLKGTGQYGCEDTEDCVTIELIKTPIAYAGEDTTIIQGDVFSTEGAFADNHSQVVWRSSSEGEMGGTFENINNLETTYTPGNADLTNGFVHLFLTAKPISPCTDSVVDSMTLSITITDCVDAIANAGEDETICEGQTYMVSGTAYNDSSTIWNTGGDGSFNDATSLQTSYTPGENDYLNGSVELCFTAFAYDTCQDNTDCLTLYFQMPPVVFAGSDNTISIGEPVYLGGAYVENPDLIQWFTTNGIGEFDNDKWINPTYYPEGPDYIQPYIEFLVTVSSINPCLGSVTDVVKISFVQNCVDAEADAGEDINVCMLNNVVQMNASAANFSSLTWATNGDGSFNYPNTLNPEYVFGENDKLNGQVILSLEAGSFGLCNPASDDVLISIRNQPVVTVGGDQFICNSETVVVTGLAENYTTFSWTTSGDGTFSDEDTFAPSYTPGNGDIANGGATVCLLVNGYGICGPVSDCMFIEITPQPFANAGDDATICETQNYQLAGIAENHSSLNWETNGDGVFNDPASLTATYTLGENDIASDTVELCLNVIGLNDCGNTSACMSLTIQGQPEVDAGNDATIFNGNSFPLVDASAEDYESVLWTTSGTGLFITSDIVNPIYFPTYEDFLADSVILTITAFPKDPCSLVVSDELTLTIFEDCVDAEAYAGDDFIACVPGEVILNGSAEYEDSVLWESNGDGSFVEPNELISGYIPGESDLEDGFVVVCLTAYAYGVCQDSTDCVTISFTNAPIIEAGEDLTICETDGMVPLEAIGQDYSDVEWTSSGDGTFEESTSLETNYILGFDDLFNEEVTLTITANSDLCPSVSDEVVVTISRSLMLYAGEDASICDDVSYPTSDAFANNATSTEWATSGDGNFVDPLQVMTEYIPGPNDISNGEVELCLSALAISPCADNSKCITLTFLPSVSIFAGEDDEICETEVYPLDAEAENYADVLWTTSGDGTFNDPVILYSEYTPGQQDIINGQAILTIEASSPNGCSTVTDSLILLIISTPWAYAGEDATICSGNPLSLNGEASNYSGLEWQSSGDGTFETIDSLVSSYSPGLEDISTGQVEICLVVEGLEICTGSQSDCMTLVIDQTPFVDAGELIKICGNQTFQLNPIVENYAGLLWTTNGDGTFDDPTVAQTTYHPGSQDTINTVFQLCLTVSSLGACDSVTDCVTVIVNKHAFAYAGPNSSIVQGETFTASSAIARNYSEILWTTIGDGIFVNEHEVTAIYIPGPEDISKQGAPLTLSAMPLDPCTSIAIAELFITILDECEDAFVNAGDDMSICEDQGSVQLSASAVNTSSLSWSSAGDGIFSNQNVLDPEYTLGSNDILNGGVKLYLFGEASGDCESALDSLLVSLIYSPTIVQDIMGQEVLLGGQAIFELETAYAETFEWYGPMGLIANNLSNLIIENVTYEDSGEYYCVLINSCGTEISTIGTLTVYEEQSIGFDAGWSGISSWIDPFDASVENIFKDVENQLVTLSNFSGMYYPGYNINTLNNWDSQDGYQVKFSGMVDQKFIGVTNTNRIADLVVGWNYLPVLVACPVDIEELFGNMAEVDLIKEIAGNGIYWPALNINSIGGLQPGNAYLIRVNQQLEVVFAECDAGFKSDIVASVHRPENMTNWNEINYSPATHIFAIDNEILDQLNIGDVIGAFTIDGTCAGMSEIMIQNNSLTLYGDDHLTSELDGFAENSSIQFKVYRPGTGEEFELNVSFDPSFPNAEGIFVSNGISRVLDAQLNATSILETSTGQINLYPNPTNADVNISGVKRGSIIDIYTSGGQVLESINVGTNDQNTNILTVDLSAYPGGVIYFRITTKDKVEVRKVILK